MTAMLLGYLLIGICVFSYITEERIYDEGTDTYLTGMEATLRAQDMAVEQTDVITEEYTAKLIGDVQRYEMDLETDEAYAEVIRPRQEVFYFMARHYTDMRDTMIDRNALMRVELSNGADFYGHRMEKIESYLNMDFSYGNYTEAEKAYWLGKAEEVRTPFQWGSKMVMSTIGDIIGIGFYLCFVIVICVSSVFSMEYESGAAFLLLTTKYGKTRMIWTKIAVAVIFAATYLSVGILTAVGMTGLFLGYPGAGLQIQLWDSVIPYNMTIAQVCTADFAILLLIGLTITFLLLVCSAGLRSSLATLVIGVTILIAPAFFPMSKESGLWNHINYLFPVRAIDLKKMLGAYISYPVGSVVFPYVVMLVIVYAAISVAALLSVRRAFVRMK